MYIILRHFNLYLQTCILAVFVKLTLTGFNWKIELEINSTWNSTWNKENK